MSILESPFTVTQVNYIAGGRTLSPVEVTDIDGGTTRYTVDGARALRDQLDDAIKMHEAEELAARQRLAARNDEARGTA